VTLVQKKHKLTYKSRHEPCEPKHDDDDDDLRQAPPQGGIRHGIDARGVEREPESLQRHDDVALHMAAAGPAQLRIFDVRAVSCRFSTPASSMQATTASIGAAATRKA
jgi:hypothetical protein